MYNNNTENIRTVINIGEKFKELVTKLSCSDKFKCKINKIKEKYNNLDKENISVQTILKINKLQEDIKQVNESMLRVIYKYLKDEKIILTDKLIDDLLVVYQSNKLNIIKEELEKKLAEKDQEIITLNEELKSTKKTKDDQYKKLKLADELLEDYKTLIEKLKIRPG